MLLAFQSPLYLTTLQQPERSKIKGLDCSYSMNGNNSLESSDKITDISKFDTTLNLYVITNNKKLLAILVNIFTLILHPSYHMVKSSQLN